MIHQQTSLDVPTDAEQLAIVNDNLLEALNCLTFCHHYLESSELSKHYTALFSAVSESLNSCNESIEQCEAND